MLTTYKRIKKLIRFLIERSELQTAPFLIEETTLIKKTGKESYHNGNFTVKGTGLLEIGSYCAIGVDVKVILSNHNYDYTSTQFTFYKKNFNEKPYEEDYLTTYIQNDVWIGDNVIILPGVTIETGAILAAGCIVTKDVPPYAIVAGCPAKIIKYRFDEKTIQYLLKSKWWEWEEEKIKNNKEFFFRNLNEENYSEKL